MYASNVDLNGTVLLLLYVISLYAYTDKCALHNVHIRPCVAPLLTTCTYVMLVLVHLLSLAAIISPGAVIPAVIVPSIDGSGTFTVTYVPAVTGVNKLEIKLNGKTYMYAICCSMQCACMHDRCQPLTIS
jgi:hypothetical protein